MRLESAALVLLAASLNVAFLYGIIIRPIIYYTIYTPLNYNEIIDFSVDNLNVEFKISNKGLSDAAIYLVIRFYNATPNEHPNKEYEEREEGEIIIPMILKPIKEEYESIRMKFSNNGDPSYIFIMISVEANREIDQIFNFNNSFMLSNPQRPTAILLKRLSEGKYMRVTSR
ncbi:MAG: hypothetical protein QW638_07870 [Candidatus Bathyarchaeia archaeon]